MSESSSNITSCRNKVRNVDEAEKEASEVLHTLLSVERIERPDNLNNLQHQVVVLSNNGDEIQWHANGFQHNGQMYTIDTSGYSHDQDNTIVWDNSLSLDVETTEQTEDEWILPHSDTSYHYQSSKNQETKVKSAKKTLQKLKKKTVKPNESANAEGEEEVTETDGTEDVRERFRLGCECQDVSCFRGLSVDNVYRHRLNIAELTKEEHDMYLMGVTMACMSDPDITVKHRERRRLRAQYVYQGRRVCLSAFLYLENCTLYQLKRIRKHVMTHGVTPRVHGNHGKKPHNVFSLDTYRRATDFLRDYIKQHNALTGNNKNTVIFPPEISRKAMHNMYLEHMAKSAPPDEKTMGYSTFRHFMKEQFPHVRFCKVELGTQSCGGALNQAKPSPAPSAGNTSRATNTEEPQEVVVQAAPAAVQASQAVTTGMVLIQDQLKPCGELGQTAYLVPVGQLVPQYQTAHAITVAPFANYAFAAL